MLTLYAREEPTQSEILKQYGHGLPKFDTVFYTDADCTFVYARWSGEQLKRPMRRRTVMLDCRRWKLVWLPKVAA